LSGLVTVETAGILFDMDGVLISSIASVDRCWRRWAEHYGVPDAEKVVIPHGTRAVDIIATLKPGLDVAEGLQVIEDMEIEDVGHLEVLPGVRALLESLPMERWAIVTSATKRLLLGRLAAAKLPIPTRIISGDMVLHGKPDPEPYVRGAELINALPGNCVVFEDAPTGVRSGVAAGCRVVGVMGTTAVTALRAVGVSWVVRSPEDVRAESLAGGLRLVLETV
jgi:sugar-phosphatase